MKCYDWVVIGSGIASKLCDLVSLLEKNFNKEFSSSKVSLSHSYIVANIVKLVKSGFVPKVNIIDWIENSMLDIEP